MRVPAGGQGLVRFEPAVGIRGGSAQAFCQLAQRWGMRKRLKSLRKQTKPQESDSITQGLMNVESFPNIPFPCEEDRIGEKNSEFPLPCVLRLLRRECCSGEKKVPNRQG